VRQGRFRAFILQIAGGCRQPWSYGQDGLATAGHAVRKSRSGKSADVDLATLDAIAFCAGWWEA